MRSVVKTIPTKKWNTWEKPSLIVRKFFFRIWLDTLDILNILLDSFLKFPLQFPGCQTVKGFPDGDARTPREVSNPRTEQIHPNGSSFRRTLHRSPLGSCWFSRCNWFRYRNTPRGNNHLPILWDLRQGTKWNGWHEHTTVLSSNFVDLKSDFFNSQELKLIIYYGSRTAVAVSFFQCKPGSEGLYSRSIEFNLFLARRHISICDSRLDESSKLKCPKALFLC